MCINAEDERLRIAFTYHNLFEVEAAMVMKRFMRYESHAAFAECEQVIHGVRMEYDAPYVCASRDIPVPIASQPRLPL